MAETLVAVVHADPGFPVHIGDRVSVGHGAVLHGCTVADDVLVGMGATVLNGASIGSWSLVAAGAVVLEGTEIPEGSLVAGVPGKVVRTLSDSEQQRISMNAQAYLYLPVPRRAASRIRTATLITVRGVTPHRVAPRGCTVAPDWCTVSSVSSVRGRRGESRNPTRDD